VQEGNADLSMICKEGKTAEAYAVFYDKQILILILLLLTDFTSSVSL
jgi:hypothetical protein